MINSKRIQFIGLLVLILGLMTASRSRAELTLRLSSAAYVHDFKSPTSLGSLLYRQNREGDRGGDLRDAFNCSPTLTKVNYLGGKVADGTCLVLKDEKGGAYIWDLCDWNGKDPIHCDVMSNRDQYCDLEVYGHCQTAPPQGSIPEPGTVAAALGILLPFILNTIWLLRRQKVRPAYVTDRRKIRFPF